MSKRIYVGNLPWSVTKEGLEELFSSFGEIEEALVIANKYTGRSRGFGFVTYKNDADADKAMGDMNEKEVEGRRLVVKLARPSREEGEEGQAEEEEKPAEEKEETEEEKPEEKEQETLEEKAPKETEKKPKKEKPAEEKEETEEKTPKETEKKPKKEKPAEEKEETEEK